MAQSKSIKRITNMVYGLGAAIVIVGALFKIIHFEIGPLTGNVMLTIGLVTEAIVFAISAFEPVDDDLDWSLVYPELAGGQGQGKKKEAKQDAEGLLSQKLDNLLKEAKIDFCYPSIANAVFLIDENTVARAILFCLGTADTISKIWRFKIKIKTDI